MKDQSFLDLKRGDRLRIVFPLSKSGGVIPQSTSEERHGSTIMLTAPDLASVEIVHYSISGNHGGLVRLRFVSAETMIAGKQLPQTSPPHLPFRLPEQPGRPAADLLCAAKPSRSQYDGSECADTHDARCLHE